MRIRAIGVVVAAVLAMGAGPRAPELRAAAAGDPELARADLAWHEAERIAAAANADPVAVSAAWAAAASAYAAVVIDPSAALTAADVTEAAYAAMLAAERADRPPRLIEAATALLARGVTGDDAVWARYFRGRAHWKRDEHDLAIADLGELLRHARGHEVAVHAAEMVLDACNQAQAYDAMVEWTELLRGDAAFVAAHPDLAETLHRIHVQVVVKQAEALHRAGAYEACGEAYVAAARDPRAGRYAVEGRYNAAVCFEEARLADRAIAALRELVDAAPRDPLARRALIRIGRIEDLRARYAEAAKVYEQVLATSPPRDDLELDVQGQLLLYRIVFRQHDRAGRMIDAMARRLDGEARSADDTSHGARRLHDETRRFVVEGSLALAGALFEDGKRKEATARVRVMLRHVSALEPWTALHAGRLIAEAACPVAPVAELCPRPRDKALVRAARRTLARATSRSSSGFGLDPDHFAARIDLDLRLEPLLAARPDPVALDRLRAGYEDLTTEIHDPDTRIAAYARLGQLAARRGEEVRAIEAFRTCIVLGRAQMTADGFIDVCDRGLASLGFPYGDPLPERLPAPTSGATPAIESARVAPTRP